MNHEFELDGPLDRVTATEYASWFKALADATRVQIVTLLARRGEPVSVGEITAAVAVGQSTVSAHLKVLAEVRFVLAERRGTSAYYRINRACVERFPTAADIVMGRPAPSAPPPYPAIMPAAPAGILIRPMRPEDAEQVLAVYQAGLDTGQASFETAAPAWDAFDAAKLASHRFVAVDTASGRVAGWVAAAAVSGRCAYAGVIEHSVYVDPGWHRRGIGAALLGALIGSAEAAGIWTIQTGVFPENTASLRLHAMAGFRAVGTRERIGCHHGRWRDVILLERRARTG
ncbi:MAG: metalloregulator ArsR/SmtB family transcription factor [Streptosporangiaceae bacterium]|nr:metalloregulator ArsR/SmtB family transcription factor [Streptosporangiaceae bacterium]